MSNLNRNNNFIENSIDYFQEKSTAQPFIWQEKGYPICYFISCLNAMLCNGINIPQELNDTEKVKLFYDNNKGRFSVGGGPYKTKQILVDRFSFETKCRTIDCLLAKDIPLLWNEYQGCLVIGLNKASNKQNHWIFVTAYRWVGFTYTLHLIDQVTMQKYVVKADGLTKLSNIPIRSASGQLFGTLKLVGAICPIH